MSLTVADRRVAVVRWLAEFESALNASDAEGLGNLFREDGSWRDVLALTGGRRTADGPAAVAGLVREAGGRPQAHGIKIMFKSIRATQTTRYGINLTEAFFDFATAIGEGVGIVRIAASEADRDPVRALTLLTALQSIGASTGRWPSLAPAVGRSVRNWSETRAAEVEYADREPTVLVIGAGQAGLAAAAWLKAVEIDTLVVDKWDRVGDSWRTRYKALKLHNDKRVNHLPFMPFPDFFPKYIPKDKLGNWLEFYADALELSVWTATTFTGAGYNEDQHRWHARVRREGEGRILYPRHIVMATGASGIPHIPRIEGLNKFRGAVIHTSSYSDGGVFRGRRVLVIGTGNSGHDVAQDLCLHDAQVTMMQRSKTIVTSADPGMNKYEELYFADQPTDECDLIRLSASYPMQRRWLPVLNAEIAARDKNLLTGLEAAGFETHYGEGNMGLTYEYWRRGGGYYIDVGCSRLIVDGKIKVIQAKDVAGFTDTGIRLTEGPTIDFDAIVLATGYKSIQEGVRQLFGSRIANEVGPVWGLDAEGEFNNICRQTAQDGLWFLAGGLPETRIFSRYLAVQIQAAEAGVAL